MSSAAGEVNSTGQEVAVSEGGKKSKLFPKSKRRRNLWRRQDDNFTPPLWDSSLVMIIYRPKFIQGYVTSDFMQNTFPQDSEML